MTFLRCKNRRITDFSVPKVGEAYAKGMVPLHHMLSVDFVDKFHTLKYGNYFPKMLTYNI